VALTSHLPHVLANVVVNQAGATRVEGHEPLANAGGSLRDMTRIAGANPRMWVDVFIDNADAVRAGLAEHRRRIEEIEAALARRDGEFIAGWIGEAAGHRRRMLDVAYGDAGALQRVQVHVADRPNVLAEILQAFGAARIDIRDFELDHVSPEQGGTLSLVVSGEKDAHRIARVLESQGYGVVVSPVLDEG
jgi:prephenate dehydrogenase